MIYGIGVDIISLQRISVAYQRHGNSFAKRVLSDSEWPEYCQSTIQARFLAKRFVAKEAFAKALGTGLRYPVVFRSISIIHDNLGRPVLSISQPIQHLLAERGVQKHHLSISDEKDIAAAFVVLES